MRSESRGFKACTKHELDTKLFVGPNGNRGVEVSAKEIAFIPYILMHATTNFTR